LLLKISFWLRLLLQLTPRQPWNILLLLAAAALDMEPLAAEQAAAAARGATEQRQVLRLLLGFLLQ
jgi:hypothetical protein